MNISSERFSEAILFALNYHKEPRKQTTIPYISHLMGVSALVLEFGGNEDEAIAGILHDVVEDTVASIGDVRTAFGDVVGDIVAGCSEKKCEHGSVIERPWKDRKDDYIAHVLSADTSTGTLLVSMADKLHNFQCIIHDYRRIGNDIWSRFNPAAGKDGTLWFYRTLADGFLDHPSANQALAKELDIAVSTLEKDG